jgi:hypothetical protein
VTHPTHPDLIALLKEAGEDLAAHAAALGTVNPDGSSKGGEESDEVADLLRRIDEAVEATRASSDVLREAVEGTEFSK